jgi:hypothetical protein
MEVIRFFIDLILIFFCHLFKDLHVAASLKLRQIDENFKSDKDMMEALVFLYGNLKGYCEKLININP